MFASIDAWWRRTREAGRASILLGYALGKAQRILEGVDASIGPIVVHGAVDTINRAYREAGVVLPPTKLVTEIEDPALLRRCLVVAPPSAQRSPWLRRFGDLSDAFASGWMQVRGTRRRRAVDRGFVLSDHADWPGLLRAIAATGASRVIVTHGFESVMVRWLAEHGYDASAFATEFGDRDDDEARGCMKHFAALFAELDQTTATNAKVAALARYFTQAAPADAAWAVYFLAGGKPRQVVPSGLLYALACKEAGIDEWLFDASYQAVGDFSETVAHVLPPPSGKASSASPCGSRSGCCRCAAPIPRSRRDRIAPYWDELDAPGRFLFNKLIGGEFRVGVSKLLVQRALAQAFGVDAKRVAQRMMGYTDIRATPTADRFRALVSASDADGDVGQPYPFFLAYPLDVPLAELDAKLGSPADWIVEWKYDGIRAQVIKRAGAVWIWSRGEELMTERFPEIGRGRVESSRRHRARRRDRRMEGRSRRAVQALAAADRPQDAQRQGPRGGAGVVHRVRRDRARRRRPARQAACASGARLLETLVVAHPVLRLSPPRRPRSWAALAALREDARERGVEGFMLKHREARYGIGRRKHDELGSGTWWKWKIDPLSVDAVLVYAQPGHGRRASLYTDYTFAVWSRAPRDAAEVDAALAAIASREAPVPDSLSARALRQGVLRPHGRGNPHGRSRRPTDDRRQLRSRAKPRTESRVRARLRRHPAQQPAQERYRRALPAHAAHSRRQAAGRGRHAADA